MIRSIQKIAIALTAISTSFFAACSEDVPVGTNSNPDPDNRYVTVLDMMPSDVTDVDLLFVIDDSGSMAEEQEALSMWSEQFLFGALDIDSSTRLNLHIAVVSTDMGAGPYSISGCDEPGGGFNTTPDGDCPLPSDSFIVDIDNGNGTRVRNYTGTLGETFGCIARLGINGCGFEQPLEAMRKALDGSISGNSGFLRRDALLAVVIVSDEDDCSASDVTLYNPDDVANFGELSSFRCFEYGVICDDDDPRTSGSKSNCRAREDSRYVTPVTEYADFLRSLKEDPSMVIVAGIFGDASNVAVQPAPETGSPQLQESCSSANGSAFPAIRLQSFLEQFPDRNKSASICSNDMTGPLTAVAARITDTAGRVPCLHGPVAATASAPDCIVYDSSRAGTELLPACSADSGGSCYSLAPDMETCGDTQSNLAVTVTRAASASPDAHLIVECAAP